MTTTRTRPRECEMDGYAEIGLLSEERYWHCQDPAVLLCRLENSELWLCEDHATGAGYEVVRLPERSGASGHRIALTPGLRPIATKRLPLAAKIAEHLNRHLARYAARHPFAWTEPDPDYREEDDTP